MANPMYLQIIWERLISACEEQAHTLIRSGFSLATREGFDVSAGVFNLRGQMLAQALTGTPGHINSMAESIKYFIAEHPVDTMRDGDAYMTNDPWKATGHLQDLSVCTPIFRKGKLIALFACTTYIADIGGMGPTPEARQVFAEGLFLPIMPIRRQGVMDETVLKILRANVREPVQVEGDVYALIGCNDIGGQRLQEIMDEYELTGLDEVGSYILEKSGEAMRTAINKLPKGTWHNHLQVDGFESPIDLHASLTIGDGEILIDMEGTSGPSNFGINCPLSYSTAYASYALKCAIAPTLSNNAATLACIKMTAPEGCITNALFPRAVLARASIGQMMPDLVLGCLNKAMPETVPAESTGVPWFLRFAAGQGLSGNYAGKVQPFVVGAFCGGGTGARPQSDGLSTTAFPAVIRAPSTEIIESESPLVFWSRELRANSGGAGRQRGGLGQKVVVGTRSPNPITFFPRFERVVNAPRGYGDGKDGALGSVSLKSGTPVRAKGSFTIPIDELVTIETPGGGGYGDPATRDLESVITDVREGFVSRECALSIYKVVLNDRLEPDDAATAAIRKSATQGKASKGSTNDKSDGRKPAVLDLQS